MAVPAKNVNGKLVYKPGGYVESSFPPTGAGTGVATTNVVVVGLSKGGVPYNATTDSIEDRLNVFTDKSVLVDTLKGGDGAQMAYMYMDASPADALPLPQRVFFVGVNPSTQGTITLLDNATGLVDIVGLTTSRFGNYTNLFPNLKIEAGTNYGYKPTLRLEGNNLLTKDDVGYEYFSIQHVGTSATCTMSITSTTLTTTCTDPTEDLAITFASLGITTIEQLVDYINSSPYYTVTLNERPDRDVTVMDVVTAVDIKTAAVTVTAHTAALIDWFNLESGGEVTAALSAGATYIPVGLLSTYNNFTGGSDGTATTTEWQGAATYLTNLTSQTGLQINHILVATGDQSIQALFKTHCDDNSKFGVKRRRTMGTGAAYADTVTDMKTGIKSLNSARAEYAVTHFKRRDPFNNNVITEYAPFMGAALPAGIRFGSGGVGAHPILKEINVLELKPVYTDTEIDGLLAIGATMFTRDRSIYKVMHNPTTLQDVTKSKILHYPSGVSTADYIDNKTERYLTDRISNIVESGSDPIVNEFINDLVSNYFPSLVKEKVLAAGLNGDPAFDANSIVFSFDGDALYYWFKGNIPLPLVYVIGQHKYRPAGSGETTFSNVA